MSTSANSLAKTAIAALVLLVVAVPMVDSGQTTSSVAVEERILEDKIPAHIPIKIRIKKEKEESFKDISNEKWLREFELEVINTGDKPIYFLNIVMGTNVKYGGTELVYPLWYGRPELGDIVMKASSDDVPIKPGETHIFMIRSAPFWEKGVREGWFPQSTKFTADFQVLSFGDGTGYFVTKPYPPASPTRPD